MRTGSGGAVASLKYGRLFTEADVCAIVFSVLQHHGLNPETARHDAAGALRTLDESGEPLRTTFPADEPLLVLRASEVGTVDVMAAVYNAGDRAGWSSQRSCSSL